MTSYRLTKRARRDLRDIWRTIAADSESNADRFLNRLVDKIRLLGANPYLGRNRDELKRGYRSFPVGRYLILYRTRTPGIEVAHVLHGNRDLDRIFDVQ